MHEYKALEPGEMDGAYHARIKEIEGQLFMLRLQKAEYEVCDGLDPDLIANTDAAIASFEKRLEVVVALKQELRDSTKQTAQNKPVKRHRPVS